MLSDRRFAQRNVRARSLSSETTCSGSVSVSKCKRSASRSAKRSSNAGGAREVAIIAEWRLRLSHYG